MTESLETETGADAADAELSIIYVSTLHSIDEVVEHVTAAETLGLGFRVESYVVSSAEEPHAQFDFTLLAEQPVQVSDE